MDPQTRTKLLAARYLAATQRPYLASALYALSVVPSTGLATMGVDRHWRLYVCAEFVEATPVDELAGVWIHEVAHLLRDHHGRADRLPDVDHGDHLRTNLAQDCEINDDLIADGLALPESRVEPDTFGLPRGRMFEEYLRGIPRSVVHVVECGSGAHGRDLPWELGVSAAPAVSPVEADAMRRHTANEVRRHYKQAGSMPGGWLRWAEEIAEPTVDWRQVLGGAVRQAVAWAGGAVDYTYSRPSRRNAALRTVVLPSLRRPLPRVAVVIDTSGSMSPADLAAALGEVTGVLRSVGIRGNRGNRVSVLSCDAVVHTSKRVSAIGEVEVAGGGGTDMRVGIAAALAEPHPPQVIVVLTDGYTPWPAESSRCRVIAALLGDSSADPPPWIEAIRIPVHKALNG